MHAAVARIDWFTVTPDWRAWTDMWRQIYAIPRYEVFTLLGQDVLNRMDDVTSRLLARS
jgi:hypothetical protein